MKSIAAMIRGKFGNMKHTAATASTPQQIASLDTDQSLKQAIAHHQAGRLQDAENLYRAILQLQPSHPEAILNLEALALQAELVALFAEKRFTEATALAHKMTELFPMNGFGWLMLGMLSRQMGRSDDALALTQKGAVLLPDYAAAHYNLGIILFESKRLSEAEASFMRTLEIKPEYAEAHNNLGCILKDMGRLDEAEVHYRQALQIKPDFAEAHNNLGLTLHQMNRLAEAETSFQRALQTKPNYAEAYGNLGGVLMDCGRLDEALVCFQQQISLAPGNSTAQHLIASLTGNNTERAPVQYIESVFDDYADRFDTHLQQELKYDAPKELVALITQHSTPPIEKWNVLDLGCGTGLVGSAIGQFAQHLVGVDLSTKMLKKAQERNLYQRLEKSDLLTMMRNEKASSYDVIIAADVFVYLGKLDEIFSEIKRLLRPGGVFAFSIEDLEVSRNEEASQENQDGYRLENTGRYTHSISYVSKLAADNSFLIHKMVATQIRMQSGKPVGGYLALWQS